MASAAWRPEEILAWSPTEADRALDHLEAAVPRRPPLFAIDRPPFDEALVFGDSHGDWRSTAALVDRADATGAALIGLGDYIDRAPADCGAGSVANALFLLGRTADDPARAVLLQGNHELTRRIPVAPHSLRRELDRLWGDDPARYARLLSLLERGPLAATLPSGVYLAHAGFPTREPPGPWTRAFEPVDTELLGEVAWAEADASPVRRGAAAPWGATELDRFLARTGLSLFLRGHDPDLTGRPLYAGRVLTLHTCRIYEQYGGVIAARVPASRAVRGVGDVRIEHLPTEGRTFDRLSPG